MNKVTEGANSVAVRRSQPGTAWTEDCRRVEPDQKAPLPSALGARLEIDQIRVLLQSHYRMQLGNFITLEEKEDYGWTVFSETSAVPMWNHTAWLGQNSCELERELLKIAARHEKAGRRPVLYLVEPQGAGAEFTGPLAKAGFEPFDHESWMVYGREQTLDPESERKLEVRRVRSEEAMADFIAVFYAAYQIQEKSYADLLRRQLSSNGAADAIWNFVAYAAGEPVSIATLMQSGGAGCIYNVGTLPSARKRGFGRAMMAHVIGDALGAGQRPLFLQVDCGSSTEELYQKIGFCRVFTRRGYRLKEWSRAGSAARRDFQPLGLVLMDGDRIALANPAAERERLCFEIPLAIQQTLPGFAAQNQTRPEIILMSAWACVLSRYANEPQVEFGVSLTRNGAPIASVLRRDVPEAVAAANWWKELEKQIAGDCAAAAGHFNETAESWLSFGLKENINKTALLEVCWEGAEGILEFRLPAGRCDHSAVRRLAAHLFRVLEEMLRRPGLAVKELEITSVAERRRLLKWGKGNECYLDGATLGALFAEEAARSPAAVALEFASPDSKGEWVRWRYDELNARANRIARHLRKRGAGPNRLVGLCLERSLEMIAALWGVIQAGGVCVPLDPSYPAERLRFMLEDSGADLLVTERTLRNILPAKNASVICLDDGEWEAESADHLPLPVTDEDLAYMIYTSGSTGRPKGVLITRGAIANHCLEMRRYYGLSRSDRVLQFSPYNFDAAFEQIFTALISGACLVVRGREVWNARQFTELAARHALTVADLPTAYWQDLLQHWNEGGSPPALKLRLVIVGGEALRPETVEWWRNLKWTGVRLVNAYGPTEATITASSFEVGAAEARDRRVPIGRARGARELYVVDRWGHLVPQGVAGELWIGGRLLARGYHRRDELTAEKFVAHDWDAAGGRAYRTGDLVRFLNDGNLEFLGRVDDQVKLRGFRIELGEIESCLHQHPGVRAAAAALRANDGEKALAAYVAPKEDAKLTGRGLRSFLQGKLPDYMIPREWHFLERLPVTPSGKVDRRALLSATCAVATEELSGKSPSDPLELQLQLIFERVLRRRPVGVDVSFFELGGDSLQALEVIVEIERATGCNLPMGTLFQSSTVEALAGVLRNRSLVREWTCLVPLQPGGDRPPLFLIHTTPGDVLGYGNLIYHLGADQPCYGFQSRGLHRVKLAQTRIKDMAGYYVDLLREFQPRGPYFLGGWCYGGLVAVEMADQLRRAGQSVALLALLETVAPAPSLRMYRYYLHRLGCFFRMRPSRWLLYVREKIRYYREARIANRMRFRQVRSAALEDSAAGAQGEKRLAQLEQVYHTNMRALRKYRATFFPGKVTLFNASEQDPALIPDPEYGWPGLAAEIEIHTVPGNHDTMLAEPHVKVLAEKIRACLDRSQIKSL